MSDEDRRDRYRERQEEGLVTVHYTGEDVRIEHALRTCRLLHPVGEVTREQRQAAWQEFIDKVVLRVTDNNPID
jgi:hypothetical protein